MCIGEELAGADAFVSGSALRWFTIAKNRATTTSSAAMAMTIQSVMLMLWSQGSHKKNRDLNPTCDHTICVLERILLQSTHSELKS